MAKKLSSREQAVKAKKKASLSVAPKASSRITSSKTVSPLVGAGPLLPGQTRQENSYGGGSQLKGAGPLLPGQTRAEGSYTGGGTREQAAKAQKKQKGISYNDLTKSFKSGGLTLDNAPKTPTLSGQTTLQQGGGGSIFDTLKDKAKGAFFDITSGMGEMAKNGSLRAPQSAYTPDDVRANNRNMAVDSTFGIPTTNASNIPDFPTGYGDNGEIFYNGATKVGPKISDFVDPETGRMRGEDTYGRGRETQGDGINTILGIPTANASGDEFSGAFSPRRDYRNDTNDTGNNESYDNGAYSVPGQSSSLADIAAALGTNPADTPMEDNPGGTVKNRSGRGSGAFGTGKGIQSDDPYIKELRKAYSSNGGEKWLRKQFDELIAALDPTYAQMQKEGTDALNSQLNEQNTKLASVMNAGNVGDSEQRSQLMAQQQQGTQTALGNLLAKLAQAKAGDISQYKSQMAGKMSEYQQNQQTNAQKLQEAIRNYQNDKYDQEYKNASLSQKGGSQKNMSLKAIGFDKFGTENMWVDQSTGDIYDNSDFQQ